MVQLSEVAGTHMMGPSVAEVAAVSARLDRVRCPNRPPGGGGRIVMPSPQGPHARAPPEAALHGVRELPSRVSDLLRLASTDG